MNKNDTLISVKRIGTGLAFVIFPLVFVFAFATHPGLTNPHFLDPQELILRAHKNDLLQFGHALVTLNTGLLVVVALHFIKLLDGGPYAALGFIGGVLAVFGALVLAADKGALCLTMSALDTLPDDDFAQMMPGLFAIFSLKGWMILLSALPLLALGFAIQSVGLLATEAIPRWQGTLFFIGVLFVGTPDGVEIVNLAASILLALACVPYGIRMIYGLQKTVAAA